MDFFTRLTHKKTPQNNFSCQNFSSENYYFFQSTTYRGKYGLPRGVTGRRAAIKWLLKRTSSKTRGILYFADDDNTYDLRLFNELLKIDSHHGVGMFPVGMAPISSD